VPVPVLAEAWRGGSRQASLARFLALCDLTTATHGTRRVLGSSYIDSDVMAFEKVRQ